MNKVKMECTSIELNEELGWSRVNFGLFTNDDTMYFMYGSLAVDMENSQLVNFEVGKYYDFGFKEVSL